MLSPTYEITTALSHTDELISPPYDIAIVTISYGRVTMSSVWDSMMSKKNVGWPFYAAVLQQRKKRAFNKRCASEIESGFQSRTTQMWRTLSRLSKNLHHNAGPSGDGVAHYESLAKAPISVSFDNTFENEVLVFLHQYDTKCVREPMRDRLEFDILNENITVEEIKSVIDSLKITRRLVLIWSLWNSLSMIKDLSLTICASFLIILLNKKSSQTLGQKGFTLRTINPDSY